MILVRASGREKPGEGDGTRPGERLLLVSACSREYCTNVGQPVLLQRPSEDPSLCVAVRELFDGVVVNLAGCASVLPQEEMWRTRSSRNLSTEPRTLENFPSRLENQLFRRLARYRRGN